MTGNRKKKKKKMHSSKQYPLHNVGEIWLVWYMPDWYNRAYYNGNTPTIQNSRIEIFQGTVVSSKWMDNKKAGYPYGWLVVIQLEDGSYRSLYECKCQMISSPKNKTWSQTIKDESVVSLS